METKFEKQLKSAFQNEVIQKDEMHLKAILEESNKEFVKQQRRKRIGFWEFFIRQIRYLSYSIWLAQGLVLMALIGLLAYAYGGVSIRNEGQIAILLNTSAVLVLLTSVPFIARSIRYGMNEVETATKFSISRLLMAKLLMIGIGDAFMILGLLMITALCTSMHIGYIVWQLLMPFLLMSSVVLYLMGHIPAEKFSTSCIVSGVLVLAIVILIGKVCPWIFAKVFWAGRIGICAALIGVCISQIRYIMSHGSVMELQVV